MRAHKGPRTGGGTGVGPLKGNEVEGLVEVCMELSEPKGLFPIPGSQRAALHREQEACFLEIMSQQDLRQTQHKTYGMSWGWIYGMRLEHADYGEV